MALAPGSTLGRYELISLIGSGGMGVVYKARDTRLRRPVAIKLLSPELTRDATAKQRFLQEAQTASALDHPNICTIHEIDETPDGQLYLVMAHYDGETLKQRIERGGLPVAESLGIAIQVGEGLAKAHDAGIVHRDVKPANVMVTADGTAKILDFGLAKLAGTEGVTQTGTTVGTVAYMSPEQARGQDVDHRSDVWSLGVVLYEMLSGQQPFRGENLLAISNAIMHEEPAPLSRSATAVPPELARPVERMLAKGRDDRPQTVADALGELRARAPALQGEAAGAAAADAEGPSVAVLPFANMSTDPENEFFADGITEDIINALTQLDGLHVPARTSSFAFKGQTPDIALVGAKLKVKTVLEGSVRRSGNRLRVTAQLINVADGYHIWSERYDRELEDVFAIQDEIATRIADRLKVTLGEKGAAPLVTAPTDNLEAYELYVKGRALLYQRGPAIARGLECLERAVALDPGYALAWAGVADAYTTLGYYGFAPASETVPRAKEAARRAVELGPSVAEAHNALAAATLLLDRDYAAAEREFERALKLNPTYIQALAWYGVFYLQLVKGRMDEGLALCTKATAVDPLSGYATGVQAISLALADQRDEAIDQALAAVERDPEAFLSHWVLNLACHWGGRFPEAVAAGTTAVAVSARLPLGVAALASTYADWGKAGEARALHDELVSRATREFVQPTALVYSASAVRDLDAAIAYARRALDERDPLLVICAAHWPDFALVRADRRFDEILAGLGLT